jgi:hypothetical protein
MFKNGQIIANDEEFLVCPSTLTTEENIEQVCVQILSSTTDGMADQLQISHGSASNIIHQRLHFHKVCAMWVPETV